MQAIKNYIRTDILKLFKFASIDVGSNAVRLLFTNVFETDNGPIFRKLSLVRVPIRLGEDAFIHGKIGEEKTDQLIKTMRSFRHLMNVHQVLDYRAYATSAMREASNSKFILSEIKRYADIDLQIVSGDTEADTISFEDLPDYIPHLDGAVFIDVGGGSTELTYLKEGHKIDSISLKIGTIRLLHNTVSQELWDELKAWLDKNNVLDSNTPILGTGGNINKILKVLRKQQSDYFITVEDLKSFSEELSAVDYDERISRFVLNPDRADVILPACKIFLTASAWLGSERIYVPKLGLSDGIARDLYKKYKA
ncbi:MAG: exopolyphosphatase [Bacteroidetes bacterium]|nr:MAG: exopolyphosphatase [Bacteroidota bacterium]